jgi:hypothetical protein
VPHSPSPRVLLIARAAFSIAPSAIANKNAISGA